MSGFLEQGLEIAAAIMILTAFALNQFRGLDRHAMPYLVLNLAGSIVLAVLAWSDRQWGFLLLQAAWGLVSLWGLLGRLRQGASA
jgi:hypothetical protein